MKKQDLAEAAQCIGGISFFIFLVWLICIAIDPTSMSLLAQIPSWIGLGFLGITFLCVLLEWFFSEATSPRKIR